MTVQYRIMVGKTIERTEGPDDADLVVTVPLSEAGLDPTVAFMKGVLKSVGPTGTLLEVLASGDAAAALRRLTAGDA